MAWCGREDSARFDDTVTAGAGPLVVGGGGFTNPYPGRDAMGGVGPSAGDDINAVGCVAGACDIGTPR